MRLLMKTLSASGFGLLLLLGHATANANSQAQRETAALLDFVERSGCQFVRNGSEYSAAQARDHLEKKLAYLERKKLLNSTENFIELAASKSSMSGKPYEIRCPTGAQPAGEWLKAELRRMRQP